MKIILDKIFKFINDFVSIKTPHDKTTHLTHLCIIGTLLILPFFITINQNNSYNINYFKTKLPPLCLSKSIFNSNCPGCGMTRSFICIVSLKFKEAFKYNRASILLFIFFVYMFIFHAYGLKNLDREIPNKLCKFNRYFSSFILFVLITNWIFGIYLGSNGGLPNF